MKSKLQLLLEKELDSIGPEHAETDVKGKTGFGSEEREEFAYFLGSINVAAKVCEDWSDLKKYVDSQRAQEIYVILVNGEYDYSFSKPHDMTFYWLPVEYPNEMEIYFHYGPPCGYFYSLSRDGMWYEKGEE